MFEKNLTLIMLFDIYGELLTEAQKTMFDLYYNDDLSLAEIAENTGISRQGARDSIKRAEETLLSYEKKLHLAEKIDGIQKKTTEALLLLDKLKGKHPTAAEDLNRVASLLGSISL